MTDKTKSQIITIVVALVASILGGGGGSYAVNSNAMERLVKVETKLEAAEQQRDDYKKQLDDILKEVKDGQLYLRDKVMPTLASVQTDVAVLKTRR